MERFSLQTLGCKVNQYESEAVAELLIQDGWRPAEGGEAVDLFIINTCTVTHASDSKCRQAIRRARRDHPQAVVAVMGCYSQTAPELMKELGCDIILGTRFRSHLPSYVRQFQKEGRPIIHIPDLSQLSSFDSLRIHTEQGSTRAAVKVQDGCDRYCTYCKIPYARGPITSRPLAEVRREAEVLAGNGFKELVITGIHVASYGRDLGGEVELIDLIEEVAAVPGIERIRLSSIEPRWISREKLERMKKSGKVCDHFHLSLQSGSNRILRRMNRHYSKEEYLEKTRLIRSVFPNAGLTTDLIVGFPGEEEEDFQESLDFCREVGFSKIHIFPYSAREGTAAAGFDGQVDPAVKKQREKSLHALEEEMRGDFLRRQLDKTLEVLFEEKGGDSQWMEGYSTNYLRVKARREPSLINRPLPVKISAVKGDKLVGEPEDSL